jgi:hypothetical protein
VVGDVDGVSSESERKHKSIEGRLAGMIDSEALDRTLDWNKQRRIAAVLNENDD